MVALKASTHTVLDGSVKVYGRGNSNHWQATFKIDQHWIRVSTGQHDLEEAKTVAREQYLDYKFREKHGLPVVSKRFEDVANLAILDMQRQLDAGAGRKVYRDYIQSINSYFIPFFGKTYITNLDPDLMREFNAWRTGKIGRDPRCLIPRFDGVILSQEWKEALWDKFVMGAPRPRTPSELQYSDRKSKARPPSVRGRD